MNARYTKHLTKPDQNRKYSTEYKSTRCWRLTSLRLHWQNGQHQLCPPLHYEQQSWTKLTIDDLKMLEHLKQKLKSSGLALLRGKGHTMLENVASNRHVGFVQLNDQADGQKKPLGYWARSLTTAGKSNDRAPKQFGAVFWTALLLRSYPEHAQFWISTDQNGERWIINPAYSTGKRAQWPNLLS